MKKKKRLPGIYGEPRRLRVIRVFDPWSSPLCTCPAKYSLQPYTGCSHFCLYCYATAYIGRRPSTPKRDFLRNLRHDLAFINKRLVIELSTSSDPYPPVEEWLLLTRLTLETLAEAGARILITTKSGLIARDRDILAEAGAGVMITITTLDEELARKLEPGAPAPRERLAAMEKLREAGVRVGARIDPVIPGLNDDPAMLRELVAAVAKHGGEHIVTSTYKARPDNLARMMEAFPEKRELWRRLYLEQGERVHGYRYLPRGIRERLLRPVLDEAGRLGLTYAVCREGLYGREFFNAPSCDGSHLVRGAGAGGGGARREPWPRLSRWVDK